MNVLHTSPRTTFAALVCLLFVAGLRAFGRSVVRPDRLGAMSRGRSDHAAAHRDH